MPDSVLSDGGPPKLTPEALAVALAALAAFTAGPYEDAEVIDAATLVADCAVCVDAAARGGGLSAVTTVGVVTICLARTAREMQPLLAWAGAWLSAEITAGRVTGDRPLRELAALARETGAGTADCAFALARALGEAVDLIRRLAGPEPDFAGDSPYDDLDTVVAANLGAETARYLAAAVQGGGVTAPATLAGVTAGLAGAARRMPPLLARAADWLSAEITAGRVAGDRPLADLTARARGALEAAAWLAADLAAALESARDLAAALR